MPQSFPVRSPPLAPNRYHVTESSTKNKAACPSCRARFVIPDGMVGKKAKCPKCGQPFIIAVADSKPPQQPIEPPKTASKQAEPPPPVAAPTGPPPNFEATVFAPTASVVQSTPRSAKKVAIPAWALSVGVPLLTLGLGYFVGREHVKYQMRSAFADFGKNVAEGMRQMGAPGLPAPAPRAAADPVVPKPQVPKIALGEIHDAGQFTVQVAGAKISPVRLRDFQDDSFESDSPYLGVAILFRNKDERKSLRFSGTRAFNTSRFRVRDDVDNVVRPVGFGLTTKVVGAIEDVEELNPEESLQHLAVFEVPLPKTQSLTLTIDLECFDGEGEVLVEIPYEAVEKP